MTRRAPAIGCVSSRDDGRCRRNPRRLSGAESFASPPANLTQRRARKKDDNDAVVTIDAKRCRKATHAATGRYVKFALY